MKAAVKRELGTRRISFAEAICDERARRCTVLELLQAAPAIGRIKAARICARTGISPTRRIEDLGRDDRIALGQKLA